jgi:hypothetical protein
VWKCVEVCGSVWKCVEVCGSVWKCVEVCGSVWKKYVRNNKRKHILEGTLTTNAICF